MLQASSLYRWRVGRNSLGFSPNSPQFHRSWSVAVKRTIWVNKYRTLVFINFHRLVSNSGVVLRYRPTRSGFRTGIWTWSMFQCLYNYCVEQFCTCNTLKVYSLYIYYIYLYINQRKQSKILYICYILLKTEKKCHDINYFFNNEKVEVIQSIQSHQTKILDFCQGK